MSEAAGEKGELAIRDKAIVHQQRRLKQAARFTHKDSADLLPLDGLKRLGTSKDLQPHSIVQRRLLEGNVPRLKGEAREVNTRVRSPLADVKTRPAGEAEERSESTADDSTEERESLSERSEEEEESSESGARRTGERAPLSCLQVHCKCSDTDVRASINTGSRHNHISSSCCHRLGLVPTKEVSPCGVTNSVMDLRLQLGSQTLQCSACVEDDDTFELCLGLQTLMELKCCLDLDDRVLRLPDSGEELRFINTAADSCPPDSNKNM